MNSLDFPSIATSFQSASNDMLAAILDQSADCIKVIGPTGSLDFMNPTAAAQWGSTISPWSRGWTGGTCGRLRRSR